MFAHTIRVEHAPRSQSQRGGREFEPLMTIQRWNEETKILHGDFVAERVSKIVNHVVVALLPAAIEAAKKAKAREEEEEKARIEQEKLKAEAEAKDKPAEARVESEVATEDTSSPTTASEAPPADVSESSAAIPAASDDNMAVEAVPDSDTNMSDASPAEAPAVEPSATAEDAQAEGSASAQAPRVTVTIHGNVVDITDLGIDPDFLEALPDDMREEVLNQHVRDQRAARVERPPDSQISSEFLDALPPEIRAEILQQEAVERSRRQAEEAAPSGGQAGGPGGPVELDPATFIASLDPILRQAVLMEQDEGFIATLPHHMIAEADGYREELAPRRRVAAARMSTRGGNPAAAPTKPKPKAQHDAIQLLDKSGVAVLVRLLFFPKALRKSFLFKIFVNLCQNSKTRTELFNFLLSILQDGTGDLAAVDKSFAQMSVRSSKPQTPKSVSKQKPSPDYLSALSLPASQMEAFPDLVAKKCLDALTYIVTANSHASLFFLTEHELPVGLRRAASKKGKGKEKQAPQSHYPIVLLLGLLDRKALLRTPAIMDSVVNLLSSVTKPLTELKDRSEVPEPEASSSKVPQSSSAPNEPTQEAPTGEQTSTAAPVATELQPGESSLKPFFSHN